MNNEQQAFMQAYGKCMAVAPDHEVEYFFEYKDKTQVGTFREQQLIREGITYWEHIQDDVDPHVTVLCDRLEHGFVQVIDLCTHCGVIFGLLVWHVKYPMKIYL